MSQKTLLVELLTEELPPKALSRLGESFGASIAAGLAAAGLAPAQVAVRCFASPRRLALPLGRAWHLGSSWAWWSQAAA